MEVGARGTITRGSTVFSSGSVGPVYRGASAGYHLQSLVPHLTRGGELQTLSDTLAALEHLRGLLDRYRPIMYESGDEVRALQDEIPQAYGAVEETYNHYAGGPVVELLDGRHKRTFSNYFESGYLSGRSFHSHAGYQELLRVIGRVRAEVEQGGPHKVGTESVWSLLHRKVQAVAEERFRSGQYADAVEAALKALNNEVKSITRARVGVEMDGAQLMHAAFSPKSQIIVLADLTTQSGRDMQQGFMEMFAGAMLAIRNPKAHDNVVITSERAIHFLFVASTLWGTLDNRP